MSRAIGLRRTPDWAVITLVILSVTAATAADDQRIDRARGKKPGDASSAAAAPLVDLPPGRTFPEAVGVEKRIRDALKEPAEVQYLDTLLHDAANDLALRYRIVIAFDEAALAADGKSPKETELTLALREGSLRSALRLLLEPHGLTYAVRNDTLLITTKTAAETLTSTRVYQVHDLVLRPNDVAASDPDFDSLMDVIMSAVEPETWREAGGSTGEFRSFQGPGLLALVVTHTEQGHEQIEELLATLRTAHEPKLLELQRRAPVKPQTREKGGFGGAESDEKPAKPAAKPDASSRPGGETES